MFCVSHIDFVFPVVCATLSFFIYTKGTNCDICKTNVHTAVCLLSHVELYKNIAVEAKHYFQLYHNVSYVLFSGVANHTWSSVVKIILALM